MGGVPVIRAKPWNGKDLKGVWEFTLKIDGVRAFWDEGAAQWISRNGKPLYNIPMAPRIFGPRRHAMQEGFEVYCSKPGRSSKENYKATIECVRAKTKDRPVSPREMYSLEPLDARLMFMSWAPGSTGPRYTWKDPTAEIIAGHLKTAVARGFEGLVLREVLTDELMATGRVTPRWLKVKPVETYDVKVTGIIEGTGKHKGRMGALMTDMGKVGTGFTNDERTWWFNPARLVGDNRIGLLIEVECMQLTPAGKFRHPRFVRIRYDK